MDDSLGFLELSLHVSAMAELIRNCLINTKPTKFFLFLFFFGGYCVHTAASPLEGKCSEGY